MPLPISDGRITAIARRLTGKLPYVHAFTAVLALVRITYLADTTFGFLMAAVAGIGWYAWREDGDVTWVTIWGLAALALGVADLVYDGLDFITDIFSLDFTSAALRALCLLVEFGAAYLAWLVYKDHDDRGGEMTSLLDALGQGDIQPSIKIQFGGSGKSGTAGKSPSAGKHAGKTWDVV
mmetsp:Transcript_20005/g.55487  ORF Transcript_20005/g.55487 Transcript_20005/m.55487 type:complete len:180 (-) Transcript_20005:44-583(-)